LGKDKKQKLVTEWTEFANGVNNVLYKEINPDMEENR
jgi:hypothetical protein